MSLKEMGICLSERSLMSQTQVKGVGILWMEK